MPTTPDDDVPDDVPVPKVPIDVQVVADAADEHGVDSTTLVETLEAVDAHLAERARDLTEQSVRELGDDAIIIQVDIQQHLYVDPNEWDEIRDHLDLAEDVASAVKTAHDGQFNLYVEQVDRVEPVPALANTDVLVMPPPIVQDLVEAGLSRRQASVQSLRMQGATHDRMAEKIGLAPGTIKSHCDRIDRKIDQAEKLLDLVEEHDQPT